MEHDVFISHAHKDKSIADAICEKLESARLRCWIPQATPLIAPAEPSASLTPSPRSDITPGERAGLTSVSEYHGRPFPLPGMHQTLYYHHQNHRAKARETQKNADLATSQLDALQSQLKETEAKVQR